MGNNPARAVLVLLVLAMVPLLMAITINFPADAGAPAVEVELDTPVEVPSAELGGEDFEVILDTGVEVVGFGSKISALAVTATPESGPREAPDQPAAGASDSQG